MCLHRLKSTSTSLNPGSDKKLSKDSGLRRVLVSQAPQGTPQPHWTLPQRSSQCSLSLQASHFLFHLPPLPPYIWEEKASRLNKSQQVSPFPFNLASLC